MPMKTFLHEESPITPSNTPQHSRRTMRNLQKNSSKITNKNALRWLTSHEHMFYTTRKANTLPAHSNKDRDSYLRRRGIKKTVPKTGQKRTFYSGESGMELTKSQMDAIEMLFDGEQSDKAIAEAVGVDVRTLRRWQELAEFTDEFNRISAEYRNGVRQRCLLVKAHRLGRKLDRYQCLNRLIHEREKCAGSSVPGDCTGLIVKRIINTKNGILIEARVDITTLREMSKLEEEIAREITYDNPGPALDEPKFKRMMDKAIDGELELPSSFVLPNEPSNPKQYAPYLNRAARRQAERRLSKSQQSIRPLQSAA
jgi:hypothetical protein